MAQFDISFSSAYSSGMLSTDRFSADRDIFVFQSSSLPSVVSPYISANIQSRYAGFDLYGMGIHIASALPMNFGAGLSIISLGHPDWKYSNIIVSTGKQLNQSLSIGISQYLNRAKVAKEARPWTGTSSVSGTYNAGNWGLAMVFAGLMKWGKINYSEQFSVRIGTYMQWVSQTTMYLTLDYYENKLQPSVGIHQYILESVALFGAFQVFPARYGLGFTIPLVSYMESTFSLQYHPILGWSPSVGLSWRMKND